MSAQAAPFSLDDRDGPAAEALHTSGAAPFVLACEHASSTVPVGLAGLGLDTAAALSHAAWDPGARDLALALAGRLDAPLVASRVSRLVHDCNRPPAAPEAMPERTELIAVPGNRALDAAGREARARAVHAPFHALLEEVLETQARRTGGPVALVTVHSFTPVWHGRPREVELGLLHDADDRLARAMLARAPQLPYRTRLNEPYGPQDGVTYTLRRHAQPRGWPAVMLELRNDLLAGPAQVDRAAEALAPVLRDAAAGLCAAGAEG